MKIQLLIVIGVVIAFAVVGAGWKWSAAKKSQPTHQLAGWSWDGALLD